MKLSKIFAAVGLAAPLALGACGPAPDTNGFYRQGPANGSINPPYKSADEAQAVIGRFCAQSNVATPKGKAQCMQETVGQSLAYAEYFHDSVFKYLGLPTDGSVLSNQMLDRWAKTAKSPDDVAMVAYYKDTCGEGLLDPIFGAADVIQDRQKLAGTFDLAKNCVNVAVKLSKTYTMNLDLAEARRVIDNLNEAKAKLGIKDSDAKPPAPIIIPPEGSGIPEQKPPRHSKPIGPHLLAT